MSSNRKTPKSGWRKYFITKKDTTIAICMYCSKELKTCSNTTNLKQHIERKHPTVLQVVQSLTAIESEHLPPHVLVMFSIDKRYDVREIMEQYADEMLAQGIFVGDDPNTAEHLAFTIKQYDKMTRLRRHKDRLAVMVSRKRSLPLLQLAVLNPLYISADTDAGERDCLALFPVGYGDQYQEDESDNDQEVELAAEPEPTQSNIEAEETTEQVAAEEQDEDEEED